MGRLRVSSAVPLFLEGKSLAKLHDGASVVILLQVSLLSDPRGTVIARTSARFSVSLDLWEERFAVTRLGAPGKSASHLTSFETEAWCLDNLTFSSTGLPQESPFWVRVDARPEEPNESSPIGDDVGVSLARLVELFSRPPRTGDAHKRVESGPFRLKDLR